MSNFLNNTKDLQKILTTLTECRNEVLDIEHGGTGATTAEAARTNLEVCSMTEVDSAIQTAMLGFSGIPTGVITLWSGESASIPDGWALCNGENGTPDLRNRFVVGAGNSYAVGATGGEATHVLTVNEMPSHTHTATTKFSNNSTIYNSNFDYKSRMDKGITFSSNSLGKLTLDTTNTNTGGGQAHENRPPYYALCYIMKL